MTLSEKLALPAGLELDRVIAEDLFGCNTAGLDLMERAGVFGCWATFDVFWVWFARQGKCVSFSPRVNGDCLAGIGNATESAPTPLLAAWRAALAWHHEKGRTT